MFGRGAFFLAVSLMSSLAVGPVWGEQAATSAPAASQPAGQVIEGLVLNGFGGGVGGARVRVESPDASADDPPLAEVNADNVGRISVRLPKPVDTQVRVRVRAEGFADWVQVIDPTNKDDPPFIDATLEGASKLLGITRRARTGEPVAGARVECDSAGRQLEAQTDAKGGYEFSNVCRGPATVSVFADGFAIARKMARVDYDELTVDIDLFPERPVELTVVSSKDEPAAEVTIEALVMPANQFLQAVTDAQGRATLHGVDTQADHILARLNGQGFVQMYDYDTRIDLPAPRPLATGPAADPAPVRQRVVLKVAATVVGTVTDAQSGEPVVGVRVVAGRDAEAPAAVAWSSLDGTYELTGVPPGRATLYFQHADYALGVGEVDAQAGQRATADAKLSRGEPIGGMVVGGDGKPLGEVWITAESWQGHTALGLGTLSAEDGTFALPHAPPGEVQVRFFKPGLGPPRVEKLASGKTDYRVTLLAEGATQTRPAGAAAKVAVGKPAPEFKLTATDGTVYKLSDLRGKYVFVDFWVSAAVPCAEQTERVKELREATQKRADFVLIGVSLDEKREAFDAFVAEHELSWAQVFGPKSGAKEAFAKFDGLGVPSNCLIGPDGRVLATQLVGADLAEKVKQHLGK